MAHSTSIISSASSVPTNLQHAHYLLIKPFLNRAFITKIHLVSLAILAARYAAYTFDGGPDYSIRAEWNSMPADRRIEFYSSLKELQIVIKKMWKNRPPFLPDGIWQRSIDAIEYTALVTFAILTTRQAFNYINKS